jgi:hypothetical protein
MTEIEKLRAENKALRERVAELEHARDEIQRDANRDLERRREVTTEDDVPPATTAPAPAIPGYMHRTTPFHTPRPVAAGEVLPPERRASWARGKTSHDR